VPDNSPTLLTLPDRKQVEVVIARRADGRLIARAAGELMPVPTAGPLAAAAKPTTTPDR